MSRDERVQLIEALQAARGGTNVIVYVTSTRDGIDANMAMDVVPQVYKHLRAAGLNKDESRVDLLIHSNGGDGVVPWRLVSLIREFASEFTVLVPNRAYSAATLMALGADAVFMHPMGVLGPIDPTVGTAFNPTNPDNPGQKLGISVEDVSSYIALVKEDVGIRHEEELVQAFKMLAEKIHPLALGTVKRSTSQSRMLAERLMRSRKSGPVLDDHSISEIIEKLTSKLYFHGHPIHRSEARDELKLPYVMDAPDNVADAMWALYEAYADDLSLDRAFNPFDEATGGTPTALPNPPQIVGPGQIVPSIPSVHRARLEDVPHAIVESISRSDRFMVTYDAVIAREWNGPANANLSIWKAAWEQEA